MTNSPIELRSATPADAEQISTLIGSTWAKFFAYSVTEQDLENYLAGPVSPKSILSDIQNPRIRFIVASSPPSSITEEVETPNPSISQLDTEILGVAQLVMESTEPCLTIPGPTIELQRLYVHSSAHGTGLSQKLMAGVEDLARKEGCKSVWLGVWEDNFRGIGYYRKCGFREVGEHKFLVGESVRRDLIMEKAV